MSHHDPDWGDHPWWAWAFFGLAVVVVVLSVAVVVALLTCWWP